MQLPADPSCPVFSRTERLGCPPLPCVGACLNGRQTQWRHWARSASFCSHFRNPLFSLTHHHESSEWQRKSNRTAISYIPMGNLTMTRGWSTGKPNLVRTSSYLTVTKTGSHSNWSSALGGEFSPPDANDCVQKSGEKKIEAVEQRSTSRKTTFSWPLFCGQLPTDQSGQLLPNHDLWIWEQKELSDPRTRITFSSSFAFCNSPPYTVLRSPHTVSAHSVDEALIERLLCEQDRCGPFCQRVTTAVMAALGGNAGGWEWASLTVKEAEVLCEEGPFTLRPGAEQEDTGLWALPEAEQVDRHQVHKTGAAGKPSKPGGQWPRWNRTDWQAGFHAALEPQQLF